MRYRYYLTITVILVFIAISPAHAAKKQRILCSTFPIYLITKNITKNTESKPDLLIPSSLGCPHDYALTPQDMQKISKADILIINGLGLEEFLGAPLKQANPKIRVVDSSHGIKNLLGYSEEEGNDGHKEAGDHDDEQHGHHEKNEHHAGHDHKDHDHSGLNPHLFASPAMVARLSLNIAAELSKSEPGNAAAYFKNAQKYADKMNALSAEFKKTGKLLKNNKIITQHGVFDYLAADMGLEIVTVIQAHPGHEPSASEMIRIVKEAKKLNAGAVFTEPQYSQKIGKTIASEAGIPYDTLDPAANGPSFAPLDYYEKVMKNNLKILVRTLKLK